MSFADIHIHALWGVDDGPETEEEMYAMLDAAWADGVRTMCLTPHFHPGYFGDNGERAEQAFRQLERYAAGKYPMLRLYPGNELRYADQCLTWLAEGRCRTLGGGSYVLVDFDEGEPERNIVKGLERLMSAGYRPVLAHGERYRALTRGTVRALRRGGVLIQIDVGSLFGEYGFGAKLRCGRLLRARLADIAATDAHDARRRSPVMSRGYRAVEKKYGSAYADALFEKNSLRLLEGDSQEGNEP
ncbi:MAG: hypothetical protein IJ375_00940 [Oscillospiraceae bacterium]|nr:hypothetical protein [Oscillospiraceae bacterium]